jgi:anti-sigma B factor antagonist
MDGWWPVSGDRQVVWVGRVAVIKLPAEIDVSNAEQAREDLLAAVGQDASLVIADMSATTFCDSAGVTALVRTARTANARGTGLRVAARAPAVTRVLTITGVDRLIEIYPSVAAAMADPVSGTAQKGHAARPGPAGQTDQDGHAPRPG